jgi:hypothetical protein
MKLMTIIFTLAVIIVIGGFAYIALQEVPLEQTEVTKTVSNDIIFQSKAQ